MVHLDLAVVADEAQLAKLFMKKRRATGWIRSSPPAFLVDVNADRLRTAILAKVRQQRRAEPGTSRWN
jgi:hypothetical protein